MKRNFTLLSAFFILFFASQAQQIPNRSFEIWSSEKAPDGWMTLDSIIPAIGHSGLSEKDTINRIDGNVSVRLTSQYLPLADDTIPGILSLGTGFFNGTQPEWYGIPFTFKPDTLFFSTKYIPINNDTAGVEISLQKAGNVTMSVAYGITADGGNWIDFYAPLENFYIDTVSTPDTLMLLFYSSFLESSTAPVGSVLNVDAVRLGYKTAPTLVESLNRDLSINIYPNPAREEASIRLSELVQNASLMVFDVMGRVVTHEFVVGNNYLLNTSAWETGVYSYVLLSNSVVVSKGKFLVAK
jgi:hypothetical protein